MKSIIVKLKPAKIRNPYCAVLTRTSKFDSRLKRNRTRQAQQKKAISNADY